MTDSILDRGCYCHLGMPPCTYCTDTYECETCGRRCITDEQEVDSAVQQMVCDDCYVGESVDDHEHIMAAVRAASGG